MPFTVKRNCCRKLYISHNANPQIYTIDCEEELEQHFEVEKINFYQNPRGTVDTSKVWTGEQARWIRVKIALNLVKASKLVQMKLS